MAIFERFRSILHEGARILPTSSIRSPPKNSSGETLRSAVNFNSKTTTPLPNSICCYCTQNSTLWSTQFTLAD
eukprot:4002817-Amphidinium_carterae.1